MLAQTNSNISEPSLTHPSTKRSLKPESGFRPRFKEPLVLVKNTDLG